MLTPGAYSWASVPDPVARTTTLVFAAADRKGTDSRGSSLRDARGAASLPESGAGSGPRAVAPRAARVVHLGLATPSAFGSSRSLGAAAAALRSLALPQPPDGQPSLRRRGPRPAGTPHRAFADGGRLESASRRLAGLTARRAAVSCTTVLCLTPRSASAEAAPFPASLP